MKIWIDLANSPHVLFFEPITRELKRRGHEVVCTAREFAQTTGLARLHGLEVTAIGAHGGRGTIRKARAILGRAAALRRFGRSIRPDLAVSHNSYAQALAAWSLGVPSVTIMDYEHTPANHINFRLARRVLLPQAIPPAAVARYGARPGKIRRFDGYKEQVYLGDFQPDRKVIESRLPSGLWDQFVVVVARPPADFAIYHRFENPLFEAWLRRAGANPAARIILLPRTNEQRLRAIGMALPSVIVPESPLDGANLVFHADLVVSAGGTMNREAAILGVPAYSLFAGEPAAVDQALARAGRLVLIRDLSGLEAIRLERKQGARPLRNPGLRDEILDRILAESPVSTA
jgi:uncharacterized protein